MSDNPAMPTDVEVIPITCPCTTREIRTFVDAPFLGEGRHVTLACLGCGAEYPSRRVGVSYVLDLATNDLDQFLADTPGAAVVYTKTWPTSGDNDPVTSG